MKIFWVIKKYGIFSGKWAHPTKVLTLAGLVISDGSRHVRVRSPDAGPYIFTLGTTLEMENCQKTEGGYRV